MATFESSKGGVPFPRTSNEWMAKGYTPEQAEHRMRQDVFGHDYQTDAKGNPIERGKGSAAQPTAQHQMELVRSQEAEIARKMRLGWHPGMEHAFDPRSAPAARAKKRPARRKTAAQPVEGNA
jgi:hypothetical protein